MQRKPFITQRQKASNVRITRLLTVGRPSTISWLIVAVVVYAVERMLIRRGMPHILKKIQKVHPAVTHFNAAPAIVRIPLEIRIQAASFHGRPNAMYAGVRQAMRFVMSFTLQATAALSMSITQLRHGYFGYRSTLAFTPPHGVFAGNATGVAQDRQAAVRMTAYIHKAWMRRKGLKVWGVHNTTNYTFHYNI